MIKYREMTESDNAAVAALVRDNLKQFNLDIPGTVYFDAGLDHLYDYYGDVERRYFVIEGNNGEVIGGIGFARFEPMAAPVSTIGASAPTDPPKPIVRPEPTMDDHMLCALMIDLRWEIA